MLDLFKTIIADFHAQPLPADIVPRDLRVPREAGKMVSIIGPRRSGKTYYLYSLLQELRQADGAAGSVYLNFEDDRLQLDSTHLQLLLDAYQQLYPGADFGTVTFVFDEIQEVEGWEKFVRRVCDTVSKRVFLSGSSAKLLGREIASALRGRCLPYTLLPFSFVEYLRYHGADASEARTTAGRNRVIAHFDRFLLRGGYPETMGYDDDLFVRTIQSYVDIMMYRDIIERHDVRSVHLVRDMVRRLIANNALTFSVNKYYNDLRSRGVRASKDTLYALLDHFADAFFILPVNRHDPSVAKQEQVLKRVYLNDPGIAAAYSFEPTANVGRLLETVVLLELVKRGDEAYYYADGAECDFVVQRRERVMQAVQVCYELTSENEQREVRGLVAAMEAFGLKEGLLLTRLQEREIEVEGKTIRVMPAWRWALSAAPSNS